MSSLEGFYVLVPVSEVGVLGCLAPLGYMCCGCAEAEPWSTYATAELAAPARLPARALLMGLLPGHTCAVFTSQECSQLVVNLWGTLCVQTIAWFSFYIQFVGVWCVFLPVK